MCLVAAEGIALKAPKIQRRYTRDLDEVDWPWLQDLIDGTIGKDGGGASDEAPENAGAEGDDDSEDTAGNESDGDDADDADSETDGPAGPPPSEVLTEVPPGPDRRPSRLYPPE